MFTPDVLAAITTWYSFQEPAELSKGFMTRVGANVFWITKELVGDSIMGRISAIASGAGLALGVEVHEMDDNN